MSEQVRKQPRTREGVVVSAAPQKTAVVSVRRQFRHPHYHKFIFRSTKYIVHDEKNECAVGDRVVISETRPLSKRKHWKLTRILERAVADPLAEGIADEAELPEGVAVGDTAQAKEASE